MANFKNNLDKHQFELEVDGHIAFARYRMDSETLYIDHVEAPEALRGTGSTGTLMQHIVDFAKAEGVKIEPICSYAEYWLGKNT